MIKYRYKTLARGFHRKDCENAIRSVAQRHSINIIELGVTEDHANVVAEIPPEISVSYEIGPLKGASSYGLFRNNTNFRKTHGQGYFWARGHFYRSMSNVTDDVVMRYVREDNNHRQRKLTNGNPTYLGVGNLSLVLSIYKHDRRQ